MKKLFGTDGVRGLANSELTAGLAFDLGRAGAFVLTKENKAPNILIGCDTRISGDMLEAALTAGMCSVGANVLAAGVIPTPAVAYLVRKYDLDAGVMISASHNPFWDNGIKFFNSEGYKLKDELEAEIEGLICNGLGDLPAPVAKDVGRRSTANHALADYIGFLQSVACGEKGWQTLSGLKIALDCANGAAYQAAPKLFEALGAHIGVINNTPSGVNINENCGSTYMESLIQFVREGGYDIGFAFDGDADRCFAVDESGEIADGDMIMAILGCHLRDKGLLKQNTIVATVMSNLGFFLMAEENGLNIEKTTVGDRYVLEKMLQCGYNFGGEQSGHIIFLDHSTTGDGLLTAIQLASIVKHSSLPMSRLNTKMKKMPQVLENAKINNRHKNKLIEHQTVKKEIAALEQHFAGRGRVLIRPSGTEPVVRVMIEGENFNEISKEARRIRDLFEGLAASFE